MDQENPFIHKQEALATSEVNIIGKATSIDDVISALVKHGCEDLTELIDLTTCGDYALAGGGFCDVYRGRLGDGRQIAIKSLRVYDVPEAEGQNENTLKVTVTQVSEYGVVSMVENTAPKRPTVARIGTFPWPYFNDIAMDGEWKPKVIYPTSPRGETHPVWKCVDICAGLCHIHEMKMVHGDLKAENVMVSSNGIAMITDFGSSQLKDSSLKFSKTEGPAITFRWAAPELFQDGSVCQLSKETDIYAYGLTALEALTGKIPFEDMSEYQIYTWVVTKKNHPPRPDVNLDDTLWDTLLSCWENDPVRRPSAMQISSKLQELYPECDPHLQKPTIMENLPHGLTPQTDDAPRSHISVISVLGGHEKPPKDLEDIGTLCMDRFRREGVLADIDQAILSFCRAVIVAGDDPARSTILEKLGNSYRYRFEQLGEPSDIHLSVGCLEHALQLTETSYPHRPRLLGSLGASHRHRFDLLGEIADIDTAIAYQSEAVSLTADDGAEKAGRLCDLGTSHRSRFERLGVRTDMDEAIELHNDSVKLTRFSHEARPHRLNQLGKSYTLRFRHLQNQADINKAIEFNHKPVARASDDHPSKCAWLIDLGESYMYRHRLSENKDQDLSDVESAAAYFERALKSPMGKLERRFKAAHHWAACSILLEESPEQAYEVAIKLLSDVVWLGATANQRDMLLNSAKDLAAEAASWAISIRDYGRALEWLEQGRFIVGKQILQLCTPIDGLHALDPVLAQRLESVGRQLQSISFQPLPTGSPTFPTASLLKLEEESQHRHQLALEWAELLNKFRKFPLVEQLMRPRKANELMRAAEHGPVVSITNHKGRFDALIIHSGGERMTHVPLHGFTAEDAAAAHDLRFRVVDLPHKLVGSGFRGRPTRVVFPLGSIRPFDYAYYGDPNARFGRVLEGLWQLVVKPILDSLGYTSHNLPVDALPHITWCTTGELSGLPLHAAGCYDKPELPKAFQFVVSSYTPAVAALLSLPSANTSDGILAVVPDIDYKDPLSKRAYDALPCALDELAAIKQHASESGAPYMELKGELATIDATLNAMDRHSWVHVACHAVHDDDPMQCALQLHDGPLSLSKIVATRSNKTKGLAFLAGCYTASESLRIPGQGIHLATALIIAGYPSVIAALWEIRDDDASVIAQEVYAELLKAGSSGQLSAARALHKAVLGLRDLLREDPGSFRRWTPFVHVGHD